MFYSTSTFDKAGISNPDVATCGTGVVSMIVIGISVGNTIYIIMRARSAFLLVASCVLLKYTCAWMTSTDGVI